MGKVIISNSISPVAPATPHRTENVFEFGLPVEADILIDMGQSVGVSTDYALNRIPICFDMFKEVSLCRMVHQKTKYASKEKKEKSDPRLGQINDFYIPAVSPLCRNGQQRKAINKTGAMAGGVNKH